MKENVFPDQLDLMDLALDYAGSSLAVLKAIRDTEGCIVDFEYLFLNKQARLAAQRDDLCGKRLNQEFPQARELDLFKRYAEVVDSGVEWKGELQLECNSGKWSDVTVRKHEDRCIVTCYNISDKRDQTRKTINKYFSLFNSIEEGFCIVEVLFDKQGAPVDYRFLETNPSFAVLTGLENVIGKTVRELLPCHEEKWFRIYGVDELSATPRHFEVEVTPLGKCYNAHAFNIPGAAEHQVAIIFNDITGRKRAENHRAYLLKLSDALQQKSTSLELKEAACGLLIEELGITGAVFNHKIIRGGSAFYELACQYGSAAARPDQFTPVEAYEMGYAPLTGGECSVVSDVMKEIPEGEQKTYLRNSVLSFVAFPLPRNEDFTTVFEVFHDKPRIWKDYEIQLIRETAERIWSLVERIRSEDALRLAEKNYRTELEAEVKLRTHELRESRDFVTAITRTVPELITIHDVATTAMIYYNHDQKWARTFVENGIAELPGQNRVALVIHPDDIPKAKEFVKDRALLPDNKMLEIELRAKIGEGVWGWIRVVSKVFKRNADGSASQVLSVTTNITEQKQDELEILEQSNFITSITSTMPDLVVVMELPGRNTLYYNTDPGFMTGYSRKELEAMSPKERLDKTVFAEDRSVLENYYQTLERMETDEVIQAEYRYCKKNGQIFWARIRGRVSMRDEAGKPIRALQIGQDITAEKENHQKLNEALDQFRNLVNNTPDTITRWGNKYALIFANKAFENKTGSSLFSLLGKTPFQMGLPAEIALPWTEKLKHVFTTGEPTEHYNPFPTPSGNALFYSRMVPEFDALGQVTSVLAIGRDITQLKNAEKELSNLKLRQQKKILNAIIMTQEQERKRIGEELHDGVGQLLYGALARLQSFKNVEPSKMNEVLGIVQDAIKDIRSISFELVPSVLKDHGLEVSLRSLFQRVLPANLEMDLQFAGLIRRLPERLEFAIYRILQELMNNTVKHSGAKKVSIHITGKPAGILLQVKDNGRGFDITKIDPMSTGIGLQSVKNRVKLLRGKMDILSDKTGTAVEIQLPVEEGVDNL